MATITVGRVSQEEIEQAKAVPIVPLAESLTQLRKEAIQEWSGPCPNCGGEDRFHVSEEGWFSCRQCRNGKRGDVIELVRWSYGYGFSQAVRWLNKSGMRRPAQSRAVHRKTQQLRVPIDEWRRKKEPILSQAQDRFLEPEGAPGLNYLLSRGLEIHTLQQFGLGYHPSVPLHSTWDSETKRHVYQPQPAILIPWYDENGRLTGVRSRYMEYHKYMGTDGRLHEEKQTSMFGSIFSGHVFGTLGLFSGMDKDAERFRKLRWLLICEGELNAVSCWQVAHENGLDVLSIGSESAKLPHWVIEIAMQYMQVIVWADKEEAARLLKGSIPGALGIKSPGGKDANDLLQIRLLGGFLAEVRERIAKNNDDLEALLWGLYDAATLPAGIDGESAKVLQRLTAQLGKQAKIYKVGPDRWMAS